MQSLNQKYRPRSWAEVVGQEAVTSILSKQVSTHKWKNVYLFCGEWGSGKTTCARIFAREINNGIGEPIEIDGASNNGVDNIRSIIADAYRSAIGSEYKTIIIDEAHQLSRAAWDAALKIIEEPPTNTVFIFCTTSPEKLPNTILSRVQRFDFKKVPQSLIADRLEFILQEELHNQYERGALERIATLANGHVRDAVQYLDKCLEVDDNITLSLVETTLGLVKFENVFGMLVAICKKNLSTFLGLLGSLSSSNFDLVKVYEEILSVALDCAVYQATKEVRYIGIPSEKTNEIEALQGVTEALDRFVYYRQFLSPNTAEALLKTIAVELCRSESR